jgi:hypothetical protein
VYRLLLPILEETQSYTEMVLAAQDMQESFAKVVELQTYVARVAGRSGGGEM